MKRKERIMKNNRKFVRGGVSPEITDTMRKHHFSSRKVVL